MDRVAARGAAIALSVALALACGTPSKPPPRATSAPPSASVVDAGASPSEPPAPFPETKDGAAWSVIDWPMSTSECEAALERAKIAFERRTNPKSGKIEALDLTGAATGWKATIAFDDGGRVHDVVVRGDSVDIEASQAERARVEKRFGAAKETSVHRSRQWETKAIEISGDRPAWRVTQSLLRSGEKENAVEWPSVSSLSWGMSVAKATTAINAAGFTPEKVAPPSRPKSIPRTKGTSAKPQRPDKPLLPPNAPRGAKLVELTFKKGEEHVVLGLVDKTGLFKVAIGQDVSDRRAAERRARELAKDLGSALSEAETENSLFEDRTAGLHLSITGFQGQRIVVERYHPPTSDVGE